jgi:threonylcarbamoyladenosine tRNA methylthiotransferase MtaB
MVEELVARLLAAVPEMAVGFDVIAGFPGESEEEHRATCDLIRSLPVAYLHVFPYSSRPGTKAADMPGHLSPAVIKARAEELRLIGEEKKRTFASRFIGSELPVLVQSDSGNDMVTGLSRNYLSVTFAASLGSKGEELPVRVTGVNDDGSCRGEMVA